MEIQNAASKAFPRSWTWLWRLAADACTLSVLGLGGLAIAVRRQPAFFLPILILAGLLDGVDGLLARRAGGPSLHGAVLDVIADAAAFGLAPLAFSAVQARLSGGLLWAGGAIYMGAVIFRLVRSARQYLHKPAGFTGLPMPTTGNLLAGLSLLLPAPGFYAALLVLSALAASRLAYPTLPRLWRIQRGGFILVALGSAGLAVLYIPLGFVAALLSYVVYPLVARGGATPSLPSPKS